MKVAPFLFLSLLVGCGDEDIPQRFTDCRSVAERVALEHGSPEVMAAAGFADDDEHSREPMLLELEAQRAGFMTVVHEQRMSLGLTGANRYAQRYLKAYANCRAIDNGED